MPCYTIQTNKLEIATLSPMLLRQTDGELSREGYRVVYRDEQTGATYWRGPEGEITYRKGQLTSTIPVEALTKFRNTLSRAYSRAAVFHQARVSGWKVKQTGPNQYEVQR